MKYRKKENNINTELQLFRNEKFGEIRTIEDSGKVLFCGSDIAKALGYAIPSKAVNTHCKGVSKMEVPTNGGSQQMLFIPEGDVYRLVSHSKLPLAEEFESWVFDEVLPTIRKTGGYVNNDDLFITTYLPFADDTTKMLFKSTLTVVKNQNQIIATQKKEIEHKEDVIIGLVDNIELAEKRQILNRVVRYKNANYQDRWSTLYREFENKYHINLNKRLETYNEIHKPKCKNKIDYIENVMDKIPELYEIAAKLFENDVKSLVDEMYRIAS